MQPPGVSAAENLIKETEGFAGLDASLENVYRVGSVVMEEVHMVVLDLEWTASAHG